MFKRWMALALASAMVLSLAACGGKKEAETTTAKGKDVVATDAQTNKADETVEDTTAETEKNEETKKDDKDKTTKKSEDKEDETEGTTKKKEDEGFKIPSSKADIVNAYKNAANKTKAQKNMDVEKTCDVDIKIDKLGGTILTSIAKEVADYFMNQASGKPEYETFKDGKPTKNTEKKNGKYINDKSTYIPLYGKEELCTLDPQNVTSAEVTRKGTDSYDVKIVLKNDKSDINSIPAITFTGMDYFNPSLYTENLKGISFSEGTVHYSDCIITATVKSDGYISYVKHDMKLKTDDTVVKFLGSNIDAALTGRYVTTFKF